MAARRQRCGPPVSAFSAFPPLQADTLRRLATRRRWRNGEIVMTCGKVVPGVMTILQGKLRITATTSDGNNVFFRWYLPGEVVGLVSAVDRMPSPVDATALDDCETLEVDRETLLECMQNDAAMGLAVSRILARHAWDVCNLVAARTAHSLTDRVFGVLSHLARVNGAKRADGTWELRISQKDIAEAVGSSRQRVNAELRTLQNAGTIRLGYGHVILYDQGCSTALMHDERELTPRFGY